MRRRNIDRSNNIDSLEIYFQNQNFEGFQSTLQNLSEDELNTEYTKKQWGFRFGTPLISAVILSSLGGDSRYLRALLQAGADPNRASVQMGTTALGILFDPTIQKKLSYAGVIYWEDEDEDEDEDEGERAELTKLAELSKLQLSDLDRTVQLLLDYGAEYRELMEENPHAEATQSIQRVLDLARRRIEATQMDPRRLEYIRERICEDLSSENGMLELRTMARKLGLSRYSKMRKADLCAMIAAHLVLHRQGLPLVR